MDISTSADLVANISRRKASEYTERTIFPYATEEHLCMDLVTKVRQLAVNKADAIYRVENIDRYDDRLIVEENLIKSYDLLMEFISKHTNDKFF